MWYNQRKGGIAVETAEEYVRQGRAWAAAGDIPRAEEAFRRALARYEALGCDQEARDLCLTLADLAMEEGNLHGADVYYVRALRYPK